MRVVFPRLRLACHGLEIVNSQNKIICSAYFFPKILSDRLEGFSGRKVNDRWLKSLLFSKDHHWHTFEKET